MRTKLLLIALMGIFITIAGAQERHSIHHCGHEDNYYEEGCSNDYGYYESDFIIGNRVYHWFTNHYGKRILKSREVYHDPHYGVYYGSWEIAYHFDWDHYNHRYFTWCPDLELYYYNHPRFVSHYHSIHSQMTFHVNYHNFHSNHIVVLKPWVHWKPWKFWKHKQWNTVWHPKHKVKHAYKPHIKHGKVYKVHGNKHGKHYIYKNTKQHKHIYKKKNISKHGEVYTNFGNLKHKNKVVKKKYKSQNNNYIVKKKSHSLEPVSKNNTYKIHKKENYQTSPYSKNNSVKVQKKHKVYEQKKSNPNNVKLTNSVKTYRRKK